MTEHSSDSLGQALPGAAERKVMFYAHGPHEYFQIRHLSWMVVKENRSQWTDHFDDALGASYRGLPNDARRENAGKTINAYLDLDVFVVWFHAIETVLRYYLAHADTSKEPWIALAGTMVDEEGSKPKHFNELDKRLKNLVSMEKDERLRCHARVVFGATDRVRDTNLLESDEFRPQLEGVDRFIVDFANCYLGSDNRKWRWLYNAYKHGLAVVLGSLEVSLSDGEKVGGRILSFLRREKTGPGGEPVQDFSIPDAGQMIEETRQAADLMEQIWNFGRMLQGMAPPSLRSFRTRNWKTEAAAKQDHQDQWITIDSFGIQPAPSHEQN